MATVEGGADGVAIKPYVKLYTRREAQALLGARLDVTRVSVHQVEIGRFRTRPVGRVVAPILRLLEPILGWYVVCDARRR
jgi:hypothetical protein